MSDATILKVPMEKIYGYGFVTSLQIFINFRCSDF